MSELSKRDKEKIQRENEIIDKAEKLFCLNGFDNTTMNELAKEVEYTKRTIYKYFSCKEDLFFAVVLRGYKRLWDNVKIESAKGKTGFEKIKLSYFAFHKFYSVEPSLLCLMGMIGIVNSEKSDTDMLFKEKFFLLINLCLMKYKECLKLEKMIEVLGMILKYLLLCIHQYLHLQDFLIYYL